VYRPYSSAVSNSGPFLDVETVVRGLTQDFCTAFNTGNYDQVGALFADDGLFMAPHHEPAQGPRGVEHVLRGYGEAGYEDLRLETTRVDYSGDMAVEVGRYTVAVRLTNGTILADRGKFVHTWRRLGAWRMTVDCWSSNLPAVTP
jgi:ketosteroid isomerase-like protein